jgi:hypothetical protein
MAMFDRLVRWAKSNYSAVKGASIIAPIVAAVAGFVYNQSQELFKHIVYSSIIDFARQWFGERLSNMIGGIISYMPSLIVAVIAGIVAFIISFVLIRRHVVNNEHRPASGGGTIPSENTRIHLPRLNEKPAKQLQGQPTAERERQTVSSEDALPPNAKFRLRGETYWHAARPYMPDEARDLRSLIRETYDYINGHAGVLVANYAGPLTMFTRNWQSIVCGDGPEAAREQLNNFRNETVINIHNKIQELLNRKPYFQGDLLDIIGERGPIGEMNAAFNDYMDALGKLQQKPSSALAKEFIGPKEKQLENAMQKYSSWIDAFNRRVSDLRPELERLSNIDSA